MAVNCTLGCSLLSVIVLLHHMYSQPLDLRFHQAGVVDVAWYAMHYCADSC